MAVRRLPGRILLLPLSNKAARRTLQSSTVSSNSLTCGFLGSLRREQNEQGRSRNFTTSGSLFYDSKNNRHLSRHTNEAMASDDDNTGDEGPLLADLKRRGLYSKYRYGHFHQYLVEDFSISQEGKKVTLNWNDGHTSEYDAIWLRHNCHCGDCKHDTNGMLRVDWKDLPMDICVLSVKFEGEKMAVIRWGTPDGTELHRGFIPTATLRCYCYSDTAIRDRRSKKAMKFDDNKSIPEIEYEELKASDNGVHKCVTHVNHKGLCLVKNVPTNMESFKQTTRLIGPLQETSYGDVFEVVPTPNPINAAFSSARLPLHMDLTFYERPPGLQILHCLKFDKDIVGGANNLLDIHEVAHKFRQEQPELFDRLTKLPLTFVSIHYNRPIPVHMENQTTMFSLNHFGELVAVAYHPMLQGPVELPPTDMVPFYEAYTAFYKMVSEYKSVYRFHFTTGDYLIFNNRRVLHGRDAFSGGVGRHLLGGYVELTDFHSRVQSLHNKYGGGRVASRCGSNSWF